MSVLPSRFLSVEIIEVVALDYWTVDDGTGDPWLNQPYRWTVTMRVKPQAHSSHLTRQYQTYDGLDISVGDWVSDIVSGNAVKIIEIPEPSYEFVTVVVEDIDRFNTFNDPSQQGIGACSTGNGFIYQIADDGLPILSPMTANQLAVTSNFAWQLDQIGRFRYRNYLRSNYPVYQDGHDFKVGDLIRMTPSGYMKATADDSAGSLVGSVSDIAAPGPAWFTYRPVGRVVENIYPPLPGGPGDLIYLDTDGDLVVRKPHAWAKPIYIRLETASKGLFLDRNVDTVSKDGYSSQTYIVSDIVERDRLNDLNLGDQCLIKDAGNGEWNHYIYEANDTWTLLGTQDSSNVDSATKSITITYQSDPSAVIATISTGRRIDEVVVVVKEAFNGTASLTVGTDADHSLLMSEPQNDLSIVDPYHTTPSCILTGNGSDTRVKYWLSTSGSTRGRAVINITYS